MLVNITPKYPNRKKPQPFLWFYVKLCLLYIILKVEQDYSMGKFQIWRLNNFDLQVIFHYVLKH